MSSNKKVKEAMIKKYGAECFIEKLKLRDTSKLRYKGKGQYKKMKMLTYHHIQMRSKGGRTTMENGALLSAENHQWFHKQSKQVQAQINELFQKYKEGILDFQECDLVIVDEIPLEADVNVYTFNPNEFNRAKIKRETQKAFEEYFDEMAER